jgi:hypothetical protein
MKEFDKNVNLVEIKSAELKEQMIRLRVVKKWMDQDKNQDEFKIPVECFINICLLVNQIQDTCS